MSAVTTTNGAPATGAVAPTTRRAAPSPAAAGRRALLDGARAMLPLLLGVAPFGLAIGAAVAELGVPHVAGWSLGWLVYSGSAQLAAVGLLAGNASVAVVVASVAIINVRLALYSAALAPHWRGTSKAWRLLAAYLLIDPSFAVGTAQSYDGSRPPRQAHLHYLGGALMLWAGWLSVLAIGVTAGAVVPPGFRLESIGTLFIVAIGVISARTAAAKVGAAVAVVSAVLASLLPLHLGPAVGMAAGLLAGPDDAEEALMSTWTIVLLAGLVTLAIRLVPVMVLTSRALPEWLDRIGPLTAPVAFAALAASTVTGAASAGPGELLPLVAAVAVAGIVALRTRSTSWAVAAGMLTVWAGAALGC